MSPARRRLRKLALLLPTTGGQALIEQRIQQAWYGSKPGGMLWEVAGRAPDHSGDTAQPTVTFTGVVSGTATTNADGSPIFTKPAAGTFNLQNGVRGRVYQPGFDNWNLGLFKKFALNERMNVQFRAEAYDAFNHPNWSGANLNPTSGQFGQVTGKTGDVRNMQLSLRFQF